MEPGQSGHDKQEYQYGRTGKKHASTKIGHRLRARMSVLRTDGPSGRSGTVGTGNPFQNIFYFSWIYPFIYASSSLQI
jgi:hypothetical protein